MTKIIEATFDGAVFRPAEPIGLEPNTTVRLTVETLPAQPAKSGSFLRTAQALNLEGPSDWATNLDHYLYGEETVREG